MACPYFDPGARLEGSWAQTRHPLGALHDGACRAHPPAPIHPEAALLRQFCNSGYAQGECPHFPADGSPDAVRFGIASDRDGRIRIHCVTERDHHPFSYAVLEYDCRASRWISALPQDPVSRQADTYLAEYLTRRRGA
jgi:hypothetical protein